MGKLTCNSFYFSIEERLQKVNKRGCSTYVNHLRLNIDRMGENTKVYVVKLLRGSCKTGIFSGRTGFALPDNGRPAPGGF